MSGYLRAGAWRWARDVRSASGNGGSHAASGARARLAHPGPCVLAAALAGLVALAGCGAPRERPSQAAGYVVVPEQAHVAPEYRCPPATMTPERRQQVDANNADARQVLDAMVAEGVVNADRASMEARARGEPATFAFGAHRFRIPLQYFWSQSAPARENPRQEINLNLQWPCLEPLPLGHDYADVRDTSLRAIWISLSYMPPDAPVSLAQAMDNRIMSSGFAGDPLYQIALRLPGDPVHGLEPHYADLDAAAAHYEDTYGSPSSRENLLRIAKDWYVDRDADGRVTTVIKCSNHRLPDGAIVEGNGVRRSEPFQPLAWCDHDFALGKYSVLAGASYPRAYLGHWRRIEERVGALLDDSVID